MVMGPGSPRDGCQKCRAESSKDSKRLLIVTVQAETGKGKPHVISLYTGFYKKGRDKAPKVSEEVSSKEYAFKMERGVKATGLT